MNGSDAVQPLAARLDEAGRLKADIERTRRRLAGTAEQLAAMTGARNPATRQQPAIRQQVAHARHAAPRRSPGLAAVATAMATAAAAALVAVRRWGKR